MVAAYLMQKTVERAKRFLESFQQIGMRNTLKVYTNHFLGGWFFKRIFELFIYRNVSAFKVMQDLDNLELNPDTDTISFIIPTWNGMKDNIPKLLQSIRDQNWPNIEIIAVDSESSDETVAVLHSFGAKVIPIRKADFRHDYARNLGAEHAKGKYLVFTVQDAFFYDPNWVALGLKQLKLYKAKSYCTPQTCGESADIYARFLSYNFVGANKYRLGVNILGHKFLGNLIYRLGNPAFRQRLIHVDDTNHMVERAFFQKKLYSINTCEDMEFGRKIILSGEKYIFSTLTNIEHFHSYGNHLKYFTRVFLDNLVINELTSPKLDVMEQKGIVDSLFFFSGLLHRYIDEVFTYFEKMGIDTIVFDDVRRDALESLVENSNKKVRFYRILEMFESRIGNMDDATLITRPLSIENPFIDDVLQMLDLKSDDLCPIFDQSFFVVLRDKSSNHMCAGSEIIRRRLNVHHMPIAEYRMFLTNLLIDVMASSLAWYCGVLNDQTSVTVPRLKQLQWV